VCYGWCLCGGVLWNDFGVVVIGGGGDVVVLDVRGVGAVMVVVGREIGRRTTCVRAVAVVFPAPRVNVHTPFGLWPHTKLWMI
jgi:hypothetical protein